MTVVKADAYGHGAVSESLAALRAANEERKKVWAEFGVKVARFGKKVCG